jgi:hypothetical protein
MFFFAYNVNEFFFLLKLFSAASRRGESREREREGEETEGKRLLVGVDIISWEFNSVRRIFIESRHGNLNARKEDLR